MMKVLAASLLILGAAAPSGGDVSIDRIADLQSLIKPRPEETKWEEIPWQIDLWDARRKAAREGKPIMMWEMDGNPMGCG